MCISLQTYKAYRGGVFTLTRLLIPAWIAHYYVKYHVAVSKQKCLTLFMILVKQTKSKHNMLQMWYVSGVQSSTFSCVIAQVSEQPLID